MSRGFDNVAARSDNSASMDDNNDADSMSKELGTGAEDSDASGSIIQHQQQQQQQQQQQRVPPTYVYSPSSDHEGGRSNGADVGNNSSSHEDGIPGEPRSHRLTHRGPGVPPSEDQLGPLPINWEKAYTENGEVYFIDHNTGTSHWLDPRLSKFQKRSLEECCDDELPYGWEKIDDNLYGTYFIDHVNRRTQYENPVIQAKRAQQQQQQQQQQQSAMGEEKSALFTRNPDSLKGQRLRTTLVKSSRGLGFTIVGGDDNVQEFLQIKSVVPNGPAWLDGKLHTGDVLVYVNDICVLGFSHNEMVNVFKSIGSGETVSLEVCRGYPLPFDPNDPNTEVVTTIAVNAPDILTEEPSLYMDLERSAMRASERYDFLDSSSFMPVHPVMQNGGENLTATASVNSMPDLCISEKLNSMGPIKRPSSTDILLSDSVLVDRSSHGHEDAHSPVPSKPPEFLSIPIVKGITGFGFTIADSAHGQKVKKILDRDRCKNLMEGDILIDINDVNVKNMCHAEVVQVLKDCCRDQEALIHVQRSANKSPKSPLQDKDCLKDFKEKSAFDFFRSKTPTADIYSTQQKTIVPQRPKTPLIDTRNSKTMSPLPPPTSSQQQQQQQQQLQQTSVDHVVDAELQNAMDGRYKYNQDYGHQIYGYTEMPYKPTVAQLAESFNAMNLSGMEMEDSLARKWLANNDKLNYSNDVYSIDVSQNHHHQQVTPTQLQNPKQNGIHQPIGASDYYKDIYALQSPVYSQFDSEHADYGSYVAMIGQEQNVDTGEIWDKRKESTSFEHEQPHSSSIVPRYLPYGSDVGNDLVCPSIPDIEWIETLVTLVRQDGGFGFGIVGGTEEGSQQCNDSRNLNMPLRSTLGQQVSVGHIVPGGSADMDGRLSAGDLIVSVDGESVMNSSHHRVVQLMIAAAQNGRVTLGIRRRIAIQDHHHHHQHQHHHPHHQMQDQVQSPSSLSYNCRPIGHMQYPYEVTVTRMENEGFGFVIISSVSKVGSTIGRIIEGSPAERCGRLNVGDHILAVNHVDITNACHKDIVNLIKDSGYSVTLTIGYPLDDCCSNASLSQKDEMTGDGDGGQYHAVELTRGTRGFGFSIRGGREFQNMPLFVLQIAENGPASIDNRLRVGDQIIEINGINTKNMTHTEAIEIIRNGGPTVRLLVRRGCQMPSVTNVEYEQANSMTEEGTRPGIIIQTLERPLKKNRLSLSLDCCCSSRSRQM